MGNFLADVGRSDIAGTTAQTIGAINAMRTTEANVALSQEQLERMKRINVKEQQDLEEANRPIAIESFASGFEGGEQGPMFKMVYDRVDKLGLIEHSQGGLGTIKKADRKELEETILEPNFASKLSRTRIDYWRGQLNEVNAALQEKPDDQKLQAAREQFNTGLKQAQYQDKAIADAMAAEAKAAEQKKWEPSTKEEALEMIEAKEIGKPTYKTLGANIYKIEDGKSTLIQKGSIEERAVTNAMHDPNWRFADEVEQIELIEKHKRFLGKKAAQKKTKQKANDYGPSNQPDGTIAKKGKIRIITKNGRWIETK